MHPLAVEIRIPEALNVSLTDDTPIKSIFSKKIFDPYRETLVAGITSLDKSKYEINFTFISYSTGIVKMS